MKEKLLQSILFVTPFIILILPGFVSAQDPAAEAFKNYTNPHDICNFYRTQSGFTIVRESNSECLVSVGEGKSIVYTQYYYFGDEWCYKLTQQGQSQYGNCVPIPHSILGGGKNEISEVFNNMNIHIDPENVPYVVTGGALILIAFIGIAISSAHQARLKAKQNSTEEETEEKTFNPKAKRSGRGSYGWEEMETTTTEELKTNPPKGPPDGQSQGGIGLHQGEPIVNIADQIEKLTKLRSKGSITHKEFEAAKKQLLKDR